MSSASWDPDPSAGMQPAAEPPADQPTIAVGPPVDGHPTEVLGPPAPPAAPPAPDPWTAAAPPSPPPVPAPDPWTAAAPPSPPPLSPTYLPPAPHAGYGYPAPPPYPAVGYPPGYGAPAAASTNAVVALVLAIVSWVVCPVIPAVVALVLARSATTEIDASGGRVTGRGLVTAARVVAWVNIGLYGAGLVLLAFLMLMGVALGA